MAARKKKKPTAEIPPNGAANGVAQLYPEGVPMDAHGMPDEGAEISPEVARRIPVDKTSARYAQQHRKIMEDKAAGKTNVKWHAVERIRFVELKEFHPQATVSVEQTSPFEDKSIPSRPIELFNSYDDLIDYVKQVHWQGNAVTYQWTVGDRQQAIWGQGRFSFGPQKEEEEEDMARRQQPQPQQQPQQQQYQQPYPQQGYGAPPNGYGASPGYGAPPAGYGTPPVYGAPAPVYGAPPVYPPQQYAPPVPVYPAPVYPAPVYPAPVYQQPAPQPAPVPQPAPQPAPAPAPQQQQQQQYPYPQPPVVITPPAYQAPPPGASPDVVAQLIGQVADLSRAVTARDEQLRQMQQPQYQQQQPQFQPQPQPQPQPPPQAPPGYVIAANQVQPTAQNPYGYGYVWVGPGAPPGQQPQQQPAQQSQQPAPPPPDPLDVMADSFNRLGKMMTLGQSFATRFGAREPEAPEQAATPDTNSTEDPFPFAMKDLPHMRYVTGKDGSKVDATTQLMFNIDKITDFGKEAFKQVGELLAKRAEAVAKAQGAGAVGNGPQLSPEEEAEARALQRGREVTELMERQARARAQLIAQQQQQLVPQPQVVPQPFVQQPVPAPAPVPPPPPFVPQPIVQPAPVVAASQEFEPEEDAPEDFEDDVPESDAPEPDDVPESDDAPEPPESDDDEGFPLPPGAEAVRRQPVE